MKVVLYDSMSALRVRLEQKLEPAHLMIRGVLNDALAPGRLSIFVWDAKGGNDARRAIFPGYKNRPPAPNDTYAALRLLQELLQFTPAWQAWHDGFEGDDVIAALVNHFRGQATIEIVTRDGDLTALCGPGVTCSAQAKCPAHLVPLYKLALGDKSDTIPGLKGFGDKAWEAADKVALGQLLNEICDTQRPARRRRPAGRDAPDRVAQVAAEPGQRLRAGLHAPGHRAAADDGRAAVRRPQARHRQPRGPRGRAAEVHAVITLDWKTTTRVYGSFANPDHRINQKRAQELRGHPNRADKLLRKFD